MLLMYSKSSAHPELHKDFYKLAIAINFTDNIKVHMFTHNLCWSSQLLATIAKNLRQATL